jgi:hypothetical protein
MKESVWWSCGHCVLGLDGIRTAYKFVRLLVAEVSDAVYDRKHIMLKE